MKKLTIGGLIPLLLQIQKGFCYGKIQTLDEDLSIPDSARESLKIGNSKMLFVYLGKDNYRDKPTYLAFIENEGSATFSLPFEPDEVSEGYTLTVSKDGHVGFVKEESVAMEVIITWENGRPQAKVQKTGEIIELENLPQEPIMETIQTFEQGASFEIKNFLFGNPNIFGYYQSEVNLINTETGQNNSLFDGNFNSKKMPGLRQSILQAGENATYEKLKAIFSKETQDY